MQIWKLIILGISGDLSQKKILPAVAQFASLNEEKVQIDLIGFSRNIPDINKIKNILGVDENSSNLPGIRSIKLIQGEYDDYTFFDNLYSNLENDERVVIYMAVPPEVFLDFIKDSCPYNTENIDIIVEKPFGENYKQVQKIFKTISRCKLHDRILFCDHYLFKTETNLSKIDLLNLKFLEQLNLNRIEIKTIEEANVDNRLSYYDKVGAFEDMLTHLFSLLVKTYDYFLPLKFTNNPNKFKINNLVLGQYENYSNINKSRNSETETYFKLDFKLDKTPVSFESGKSLGKKETSIYCYFNSNTVISWKIFPEKILEVNSPDKSFSFSLKKNNNLDHSNLFEALLNNQKENFLNEKEVILNWEIIEKVKIYKNAYKINPNVYKNGKYPVIFLG